MGLLIILILFLFHGVEAQGTSQVDSSANVPATFRPSLAVVIGILSIMFSLTFLLLVYAKFCHTSATDQQRHSGLIRSTSRFSGIDKTVIESLPFFRFSSLKGTKEGLECAVCLSKFDDSDILRLLPKCKHAFHINCVDQWLESHSSCPLCRYKVNADDMTIFAYSNSLRFSLNPSELTEEEPNFELFVRREQDNHGSSRFSVGGSFRKIDKGRKDEVLLREDGYGYDDSDWKLLHKFNHKIIVSDVVVKNRWSDVNSSDLMFLNSEMLNVMSSKRFPSSESNSGRFASASLDPVSSTNKQVIKIKEELEKKKLFESKINSSSVLGQTSLPSNSDSEANRGNMSRLLIPSGKRSMSEITNLSRFADFGVKNGIKESSLVGNNAKEERMRRLWLSIARRTVQWFAGREKRSQQSQHTREPSNV